MSVCVYAVLYACDAWLFVRVVGACVVVALVVCAHVVSVFHCSVYVSVGFVDYRDFVCPYLTGVCFRSGRLARSACCCLALGLNLGEPAGRNRLRTRPVCTLLASWFGVLVCLTTVFLFRLMRMSRRRFVFVAEVV